MQVGTVSEVDSWLSSADYTIRYLFKTLKKRLSHQLCLCYKIFFPKTEFKVEHPQKLDFLQFDISNLTPIRWAYSLT